MNRNELIIEALRQSIAEKASEYELKIANLRAEVTEQDQKITELEQRLASRSEPTESAASDHFEVIEGTIVE